MDTSKQRLRVGILLDSRTIPAWAFGMLRTIRESDYAEIALVVLNQTPGQAGAPKVAASRWEGLVYTLYCRLENRRGKPSPDAFAPCDATALLREAAMLHVQPEKTRYDDRLSDADVAAIREHKLDVLVRLGFRILKGGVLTAAKYGVWSYHHADNQVNRGGPAGFWEVCRNEPITGSILQILSEELDGGLVLHRSYSATHPLSVSWNRNNYYWKTSRFLPRKLKELRELGEEEFFAQARARNQHPDFYCHRIYRKPDNKACAKFMFDLGWRYAKMNLSQKFFREQWILLYCMGKGLPGQLHKYRCLVPPKDRFWADPHVLAKDGKYYIFVEEFLYATQKGHIAVIVMDEDGRPSEPQAVLERPYHMSYPFVFEWQGGYYMLPETRQTRTLELYEAVEFPFQWRRCGSLMNGVTAVDATLFPHEGKWWLFANMAEVAGASTWDELFLFSSESPTSDNWRPHAKNPIISDVRRSRPAGALFRFGQNIYRPSQDCSNGYGSGLRINQLLRLNEKEYQEQEISVIQPEWDRKIRGVHTLSRQEGLVVLDAKILRPRFA